MAERLIASPYAASSLAGARIHRCLLPSRYPELAQSVERGGEAYREFLATLQAGRYLISRVNMEEAPEPSRVETVLYEFVYRELGDLAMVASKHQREFLAGVLSIIDAYNAAALPGGRLMPLGGLYRASRTPEHLSEYIGEHLFIEDVIWGDAHPLAYWAYRLRESSRRLRGRIEHCTRMLVDLIAAGLVMLGVVLPRWLIAELSPCSRRFPVSMMPSVLGECYPGSERYVELLERHSEYGDLLVLVYPCIASAACMRTGPGLPGDLPAYALYRVTEARLLSAGYVAVFYGRGEELAEVVRSVPA